MISDLPSLVGSNQGALVFENIRVIEDMRNQASRLVDYGTISLSKTISAALGQTKDIKLTGERIGLDKLPDPLEEVARIRLSNPNSSLKELGEKIHSTVGKSDVSRRLKKIQSIVNKLRGEDR